MPCCRSREDNEASSTCYEGSLAQHLSQRYPPLPPLGVPGSSQAVERRVVSDSLLVSSLCTACTCKVYFFCLPPEDWRHSDIRAVHAGVLYQLRIERHSGGGARQASDRAHRRLLSRNVINDQQMPAVLI